MTNSPPNSRWGSGPGGIGVPAGIKPHAYDPATNPELFEGVLARRIVAFVIDVIVIGIPLAVAAVFIFVIGLITLGLGWVLFWLLSPASVVWALFYYGMTLGSPASATLGMRAMGIEMRTWYGAPAYFVLGAVHAVVYWISVSVLVAVRPAGGLLQRAPSTFARYDRWCCCDQQRGARHIPPTLHGRAWLIWPFTRRHSRAS